MYRKKLLIIPKIAVLYFKTNFGVSNAVRTANPKIAHLFCRKNCPLGHNYRLFFGIFALEKFLPHPDNNWSDSLTVALNNSPVAIVR